MAAEEGGAVLLEEALIYTHTKRDTISNGHHVLKKEIVKAKGNVGKGGRAVSASASQRRVLTLINHAIEPRKELLGAVVGVEDDGDAIDGSDGADEVGSSNGTSNGSLLLVGGVGDALASKEGSTTLRSLEDDGSLALLGGLESGDAKERHQQEVSFRESLIVAATAKRGEGPITASLLTRWSWR